MNLSFYDQLLRDTAAERAAHPSVYGHRLDRERAQPAIKTDRVVPRTDGKVCGVSCQFRQIGHLLLTKLPQIGRQGRHGSAENGELQAKPVAPRIEPLSHEAMVFERLQDAVSSRPRQTGLPLNVSEPQPSAPAVTQQVQNVDRTIEHLRATAAVVSRGDGMAIDLGGIIGHRGAA